MSKFPLRRGNLLISMLDTNVSLSQHSNYKIGGTARYFFLATGFEKLCKAIVLAQLNKWPVFILGGGTNLLISDRGFDGLVIKPDIKFISLLKTDTDDIKPVVVGAGVLISDLLDFCIENGLSGLEWAGGLPGTVGGAIRGNAGAFKGEIKDVIIDVASVPMAPFQIIKRNRQQCCFGYRDSIFKQEDGREIILSATLNLRSGDKKVIRQSIEDKIKWRQERQPLDYPNIGSIFKNVDWNKVPGPLQKQDEFKKHLKTDPFPVLPTAMLIDKAGLKGVSCGGAMVSQKHPNFIVNHLQASADDVKQLIQLVKTEIKNKFNIALEEEIIYLPK